MKAGKLPSAKLLLLACATFMALQSRALPGPKDSAAFTLLLGVWEGKDQTGARGIINFKSDTTVEIFTSDITFQDTIVNKSIIKLFFEVNTHTNPVWLDLVMKAYVVDGTGWIEIKRMKGILRFLSADQIELRLTPLGEHRYTSFDSEIFDEEESMILTRRKDKLYYSSL
jgi:hypothetical protein